jgi:DNA-binding response OmpR family regulator/class 3 adenylate cyclase/predicted ATPase
MKKCVLVVAKHIELRAKVVRLLHAAGYAVELAESGKRACELARGREIEAAIVVHSADLNGLEQELRGRIARTIVLRHGGMQALDEQKLLEQLRQPPAAETGINEIAPVILRIEDCKLDLAGHTFVHSNGQEVQLTRAENALLATFVGNPRRVLSRDRLRRAVVGRGAEPFERSIDMLIARLRHKIEPNPKAPRFILSVPGVGYKFAIQPQMAKNGDALPAIDLEQASGSGLREAMAVTAPSEEIASRHSTPERRQLTALSCVIAGLPALAVGLDPEDLVGVVQSFQEMCATVIMSWGGIIANSVGGEILALFGYPTSHENDAERAVHAGFDLVAKVATVLSPSSEPLQAQIGIATGLVLIDKNQAAMGEPVLTVGRLRNITPPNSVMVTASTRKLLGSAFVAGGSQWCELEGVSEPVVAYRIVGKRAIEREAGEHTRFVGRQHELQQMSDLWERAKGGKGQVVLVCGEAGIGKSRLCEVWLDRIGDEPHFRLRIQCSPYHTNSPFYPVINQLEQAAFFEREDSPDIKVKKLETMLSRAGAAALADAAFFTALLSIPTDEFYSSLNLTPQRQRELTIAALTRYILDLALRQPVILELVDAHWMDSSTLELISRCIAPIKTARILILCSFRPEFFSQWLDESHVTMLRLDRLSREQIGVVISDAAGVKELPSGLHEQIIRKADGVPLFAEELTKAVVESRLLQDEGDRYVTAGSLPSLSIPTTLLGSLTARLDKLGASKEIAQFGAAIGREFSYRLLAAVAQLSGPVLQAALAHIAACELIFARGEPPNSTYIFKHALVQDAAYATLVRSKRQEIHSRIAEALVEGFPDTVETQPELMAHHLAQAGRTEEAIEHLRTAGQRAIEHSANAEAIGQLTWALELLQLVPENAERKRAALGIEVMLGQAMIAGRGYAAPETTETLLRAKTLIDDLTESSQKFAILYGIWACHYVGGEVAKQKDAALEFLAEAERHNETAALCIAHRALGTTYVTTGEFADGLHHLERARALYDAEQHPGNRFQYGQDIGVAALCYLSWAQWHLGYVDRASETAAEAIKLAQKLSHPHTLVYAICHARGLMDLFGRRCEDTRSYAALAVSLCTENGFSHWLNCARILEGWAEICQGETERGNEVLRAGVLGWQQKGARLWLPIFHALEAEARVAAGRADAALRAIEAALAISEETGERLALAEVLRVKARVLQAVGEAEAKEIETTLVNSLEIARGQQARCWELRAACDLARLWQGQGRGRQALKLLRSVYDQFTEGLDSADLRAAKALIGGLKRGPETGPTRQEKGE